MRVCEYVSVSVRVRAVLGVGVGVPAHVEAPGHVAHRDGSAGA